MIKGGFEQKWYNYKPHPSTTYPCWALMVQRSLGSTSQNKPKMAYRLVKESKRELEFFYFFITSSVYAFTKQYLNTVKIDHTVVK